MIYGQDEPMLFPVADLYDSNMMQMYINAAREQYNQNREDMKEFSKLYGDFTSPFAEDIKWVDQQTRGRINDALNYMQANGIDPLRSAEGRALIQQVINSTDTAGINLRKQAAANKILWDKSIAELRAKNMYNKDFIDWEFAQRHKGVTPDQWSTERNGLWTDTSADPYQDLNQYTGHIFDKMEDDYMETKDGYDYFGVNRDRRMGALTPQVQDLISTPLGQYHYQQAERDAAYKLGRKPTEQEVLDQFKSNVLDATKEYEHRTRKENEYDKRKDEYGYDVALENLKHQHNMQEINARNSGGSGRNSGGSGNESYQYSFNELLRRNAATVPFGMSIEAYTPELLATQRDRQIEIGLEISRGNDNRSLGSNAINAFQSRYGQSYYRKEDISKFLNYAVQNKTTGSLYLPKDQINRLYSTMDVVTNTVGFRNKHVSTNRQDLNKAAHITITPTGRTYGALMKDGRTHNYFYVDVQKYKKEQVAGKNEEKIVPDGKPVRMVLDSHVTSVQNEGGAGSLGTYDKSSGKVFRTPGVPITNSQDSKYQDAVIGDKFVTDPIVKGTVYSTDATLSEMLNYPYQ